MTTILTEINSVAGLNATTRELDCPACNYTFVFLRTIRRRYVLAITQAFLDHDRHGHHDFLFPEDRDDTIRELIARWERTP